MISWPKGIYLEASAIYSLPIDIVNAEMERLKELSGSLETPIFIPEVSLQEWIPKRKENIQKWVGQVESSLSHLSKIFDYVAKIEWEKDKESIIGDTDIFTRKILKDNGISIIKIPEIPLKKLVYMSVNKIRPFEAGNEKGFRDTISLLTVLEYAQKQKDGSHLFVAKDKIYQDKDIQELAKQYNVELKVVPSISDAISTLEEFMKHVKKTFDEYEKSILEIFLLKNTDKISEHIKQAKFTPSFLNQDGKLGIVPQIENIDDIKAIDINSVTRGALPKDRKEGKIKISFAVKTRFDIRIREPLPSPEPGIKYGKKAQSSVGARLAAILGTGREQTLYKTIEKVIPVERVITIEGSVILRREKNQKGYYKDKYSDLYIDNIIIG
jgi:hypothetical protein